MLLMIQLKKQALQEIKFVKFKLLKLIKQSFLNIFKNNFILNIITKL